MSKIKIVLNFCFIAIITISNILVCYQMLVHGVPILDSSQDNQETKIEMNIYDPYSGFSSCPYSSELNMSSCEDLIKNNNTNDEENKLIKQIIDFIKQLNQLIVHIQKAWQASEVDSYERYYPQWCQLIEQHGKMLKNASDFIENISHYIDIGKKNKFLILLEKHEILSQHFQAIQFKSDKCYQLMELIKNLESSMLDKKWRFSWKFFANREQVELWFDLMHRLDELDYNRSNNLEPIARIDGKQQISSLSNGKPVEYAAIPECPLPVKKFLGCSTRGFRTNYNLTEFKRISTELSTILENIIQLNEHRGYYEHNSNSISDPLVDSETKAIDEIKTKLAQNYQQLLKDFRNNINQHAELPKLLGNFRREIDKYLRKYIEQQVTILDNPSINGTVGSFLNDNYDSSSLTLA